MCIYLHTCSQSGIIHPIPLSIRLSLPYSHPQIQSLSPPQVDLFPQELWWNALTFVPKMADYVQMTDHSELPELILSGHHNILLWKFLKIDLLTVYHRIVEHRSILRHPIDDKILTACSYASIQLLLAPMQNREVKYCLFVFP